MEESSAYLQIGGWEIPSVCVTMTAITVLVTVFCLLATRNMRQRPNRLQALAEKIVEMLVDFLSGFLGPELARAYLPYLGTMFIFILLANYSGLLPMAGHLPGLAAPTSSLSVTASLAICTFCVTHYTGIHRHGLAGYGKHFIKPIAFMLPLLLLEEVIRPVSLALRLYGNIFGEETVTAQIFSLVPLLVPLALQALSLLMGFVQAMVFVMLSGIYISGATGDAH